MGSNSFGIDLGTGNIKIYCSSDDSILNEKNMIAIMNKDTLFAYGDSAFEMYEKAPANIHVSYPLTNGVIADIKNMQTVLREFITDLSDGRPGGADYYISVPTDVTEVEKRSFFDLVKDSGVKPRKIMVVEKAIADGLGLDIDVKTAQGILVVDIGYATTEISILSLGGIVLSKLIKVGGAKFDEAIRNAIRKEFNLMIGGKTAEQIRVNLSELEAKGEDAVVYGRNIVSGLPVERAIPTKLIDEALREHFDTIIDNVKVILERTPPELGADIYKRGVYLTGGAAKTNHFAQLLSQVVSLKVNLANNAQDSVACGLARIIKDDKFKSVAYSIQGMSK